jgi:hypothetical protein
MGFDENVSAPNEEALGIERLATGRRELILRRLVDDNGVGLEESTGREVPHLSLGRLPGRIRRECCRGRRDLLGQSGLCRPGQE